VLLPAGDRDSLGPLVSLSACPLERKEEKKKKKGAMGVKGQKATSLFSPDGGCSKLIRPVMSSLCICQWNDYQQLYLESTRLRSPVLKGNNQQPIELVAAGVLQAWDRLPMQLAQTPVLDALHLWKRFHQP